MSSFPDTPPDSPTFQHLLPALPPPQQSFQDPSQAGSAPSGIPSQTTAHQPPQTAFQVLSDTTIVEEVGQSIPESPEFCILGNHTDWAPNASQVVYYTVPIGHPAEQVPNYDKEFNIALPVDETDLPPPDILNNPPVDAPAIFSSRTNSSDCPVVVGSSMLPDHIEWERALVRKVEEILKDFPAQAKALVWRPRKWSDMWYYFSTADLETEGVIFWHEVMRRLVNSNIKLQFELRCEVAEWACIEQKWILALDPDKDLLDAMFQWMDEYGVEYPVYEDFEKDIMRDTLNRGREAMMAEQKRVEAEGFGIGKGDPMGVRHVRSLYMYRNQGSPELHSSPGLRSSSAPALGDRPVDEIDIAALVERVSRNLDVRAVRLPDEHFELGQRLAAEAAAKKTKKPKLGCMGGVGTAKENKQPSSFKLNARAPPFVGGLATSMRKYTSRLWGNDTSSVNMQPGQATPSSWETISMTSPPRTRAATQSPPKTICPNKKCIGPRIVDGVCESCGNVAREFHIASADNFESSARPAVLHGTQARGDSPWAGPRNSPMRAYSASHVQSPAYVPGHSPTGNFSSHTRNYLPLAPAWWHVGPYFQTPIRRLRNSQDQRTAPATTLPEVVAQLHNGWWPAQMMINPETNLMVEYNEIPGDQEMEGFYHERPCCVPIENWSVEFFPGCQDGRPPPPPYFALRGHGMCGLPEWQRVQAFPAGAASSPPRRARQSSRGGAAFNDRARETRPHSKFDMLEKSGEANAQPWARPANRRIDFHAEVASALATTPEEAKRQVIVRAEGLQNFSVLAVRTTVVNSTVGLCGAVEKVEVRTLQDGTGNQVAYVSFVEKESADRAVQEWNNKVWLNEEDEEGPALKLEVAHAPMPGPPPPPPTLHRQGAFIFSHHGPNRLIPPLHPQMVPQGAMNQAVKTTAHGSPIQRPCWPIRPPIDWSGQYDVRQQYTGDFVPPQPETMSGFSHRDRHGLGFDGVNPFPQEGRECPTPPPGRFRMPVMAGDGSMFTQQLYDGPDPFANPSGAFSGPRSAGGGSVSPRQMFGGPDQYSSSPMSYKGPRTAGGGPVSVREMFGTPSPYGGQPIFFDVPRTPGGGLMSPTQALNGISPFVPSPMSAEGGQMSPGQLFAGLSPFAHSPPGGFSSSPGGFPSSPPGCSPGSNRYGGSAHSGSPRSGLLRPDNPTPSRASPQTPNWFLTSPNISSGDSRNRTERWQSTFSYWGSGTRYSPQDARSDLPLATNSPAEDSGSVRRMPSEMSQASTAATVIHNQTAVDSEEYMLGTEKVTRNQEGEASTPRTPAAREPDQNQKRTPAPLGSVPAGWVGDDPFAA